MAELPPDLRSALERGIIEAREAAEAASLVALGVLGVDAERMPEHLGEADRRLRVALRAEGRQLGGLDRLIEECAYEQWHRMLFARFLAENELLIHPEHGVAVSLADCEEIAQDRGLADPWVVASEFASAMLPGIFRADDPALRLRLTPEGQRALEDLLAGLPRDVFTSDDGLGWVYQFWQGKHKREVNAAEKKIGGADIASVTQLFTEHYMVRFLLENTLGAWWATRRPDSPLINDWEYLRLDETGAPAAGSYSDWPDRVADLTVMDPCCGSGHFLVTAFDMLRRMRMEAEGLSASAAGDAVLRENLFGLELDARCTQIAAFSLALQAWNTGGYRELPVPNVACAGISVDSPPDGWTDLAGGDQRVEMSLGRLHSLFAGASDLGSLIDPLSENDGDLLAATFDEVSPLLAVALSREVTTDPAAAVFGKAVAASALAARLLARRYTVVATNPPFLGRNRQASTIRDYCERTYPESKTDLATCFLERAMSLAEPSGTVAVVEPQGLLFLEGFRSLREKLVLEGTIKFVARLGAGAFRSIGGHVVQVALLGLSPAPASDNSRFFALDADQAANAEGKANRVRTGDLRWVEQADVKTNPSTRILVTEGHPGYGTLGDRVTVHEGMSRGDVARFDRYFWEIGRIDERVWSFFLNSPGTTGPWAGREMIVRWEQGKGALGNSKEARLTGYKAWGREGVFVARTSSIKVALSGGAMHAQNGAILLPNDESDLTALWAFCSAPGFADLVRGLDQKIIIASGTLLAVPVDPGLWEDGRSQALPSRSCGDPTQWLFDGDVSRSAAPLHVAVPRLLGYRWPRQTGAVFTGWPSVVAADAVERFEDQDGIVCLPAVRGEPPASERVRALLAAAFGDEWSPAREADLLADAGYAGKSLDHWLRNGFFEQHCQQFHQRPFVWQIWDGTKDGFSALVNYHRLDRPTLQKLAYTYLGGWIRQQHDGARDGIPGCEGRLAAAEQLQHGLELILDGEAPYDIFVRWKPIDDQPLGWEPDLADGVRMNSRPFVTAGVLRKNPKIKWAKDRGKDLEGTPWYPVFRGDRITDHHLTLAAKHEARAAAGEPGRA